MFSTLIELWAGGRRWRLPAAGEDFPMGINRIVTQQGVVWWLPPTRPQARRSGQKKLPGTPGRAAAGNARLSPVSPLPPGFVPVAVLAVPGCVAAALAFSEVYREAYQRALAALRQREET